MPLILISFLLPTAIQDGYGKWYEADILSMDPTSNRMLVHYHGWNARWDEWLSCSSERFAPRNTHTAMKKGDQKEKGADQGDSPGRNGSGSNHDQDEKQFVRMVCLARGRHFTDAFIDSRGDSFCLDHERGIIWGLCADGTLEQRQTLMMKDSSLLAMDDDYHNDVTTDTSTDNEPPASTWTDFLDVAETRLRPPTSVVLALEAASMVVGELDCLTSCTRSVYGPFFFLDCCNTHV